jgi:hypothetical protein
MLTLIITSINEGSAFSKDVCVSIIEKWWSNRIVDPSTIKGIKDGSGAVFDIKDDYYERFLDNYEHIKNQEGSRLDFVVKRC